MKNILLGTAMAGLVLAGGALLTGCGHHGPCGWGHQSPEKKAQWMVNRISQELDLTEAQKTKLNSIKDELLKKKAEFKADHRSLAAELKAQILSDKLDQDKINQLFVSRQAKHEEMRKFFIVQFAEFHAMLTPQQRAKLAEKLEKFHGHLFPGEDSEKK
jgi:protein CpxP